MPPFERRSAPISRSSQVRSTSLVVLKVAPPGLSAKPAVTVGDGSLRKCVSPTVTRGRRR